MGVIFQDPLRQKFRGLKSEKLWNNGLKTEKGVLLTIQWDIPAIQNMFTALNEGSHFNLLCNNLL